MYRIKTNFIPQRTFFTKTLTIGVPVALTGISVALYHRYKVSKPDEYLVKTGLGIKDIKISKTGFLFPFQKYKFINMAPKNYKFSLNSMSKEKLEFVLPGVFTIGPKNDIDKLNDYVRFLENSDASNIINGILEGETRILCGQLTLEEIFNDRKALKDKITQNVQSELDNFGLTIYNANIIELHDAPGSEYFKYMRQDKTTKAQNDALIKVSENKKRGDVGQKLMEAETRQAVADLESSTVVFENTKKEAILKSKATFEITKAETEKQSMIAESESKNAILLRTAELDKEVQIKRILSETERIRALELTQIQVNAEKKIKEAQGHADAVKIQADAELYAQEKKAEGTRALLFAQSEGLQKMVNSLGNNSNHLMHYLMIEKDMFTKIANENAKAIKDMKPRITVWNTGSDEKDPIQNIFKMLPPMLTTIKEQTGISPPDWLIKMQNNKEL